MRTLRWIAPVLAVLLVAASASTPASAGVSFGFFYSELGSHGSWLVSASYGRVWQPSVHTAGWNPYYDGHWVYTDLGWTWVSDYPWGAIAYHYGTWVADPVYGWVWVPGYVWAPAWVVFRTGPDYIGWCPVRPEFSVGVSFGYADYDSSLFVFVPSRYFVAGRVRTYAVPRTEVSVVFNRTTIVKNSLTIENNVVVNRGPGVSAIEKASGRKVERVSIERLKGADAGGGFSREAIRVDPQKAKKGLRAAEPVTTETPAPVARGGERRETGRPGGAAGRREAAKEPRRSAVEKGASLERPSSEKVTTRPSAPVREKARGTKSRPEREAAAATPGRGGAEERVRGTKGRPLGGEKVRGTEAKPSAPRMRAERPSSPEGAKAKVPAKTKEKAKEPAKSKAKEKERERGKKKQEDRGHEEHGKGEGPGV